MYTIAETRKSWVALIGGVIASLIYILQHFQAFLPPSVAPYVPPIIGLLTAVGVFFVPNKLTDEQVQTAQALPPAAAPTRRPWLF